MIQTTIDGHANARYEKPDQTAKTSSVVTPPSRCSASASRFQAAISASPASTQSKKPKRIANRSA